MAESYRSGDEPGKTPFDYSLLNPHLKHLPPRSKTGCWTCRKRKVKCGEERPICAQCVRLGQHCDYEVKYSFKDANKTLVGKKGDLNGNPAWDPTTRRPRPSASSDLDDTPGFTTLSTEEDRERKAAFHEPGKFYVVANQDSFSSLPEYNQSSTPRSSSTLGASSASGRVSRSTRHSQGESDVSPGGDDTVILTRFEMPTDRPTDKKNPSPPLNASRTRTSPAEQGSRHQLPLPPTIPQYPQTSSSLTSYQNQPLRSTYLPTPLDTSSLQYYNNPLPSSPSAYTPQSQRPSPPFSRLSEIPTQYPSSYQYAPILPQDSQQYASFSSRLLPQPTLPIPNSMQQQHHQSYQPPQLSTLQPSPLSQQAPFTSSTSYTHHTTPSMYHYATTSSPTNYAQSQSPNAYSSSSITPSYTPGAASYAQTSPGATSYGQTQSQTLYGQPYTVPHTAVDPTVSPQEAPSRMYSYGWTQGQGQGQAQGGQQGRQSTQAQGYMRY